MNVFVFDIETIPDIDGCRRIYDLHGPVSYTHLTLPTIYSV